MKKEEERLEQLLNTKKLEELTQEEKEFVIDLLGSLDEFEAMQKIEVTITESKSIVEPSSRVLHSLKNELRRKRQPSSFWAKVFEAKIPAYATMALILVFSGITSWLTRSSFKSAEPVSIVYEKADTVYVTRIDTVLQEKVIYRLAKNQIVKSLRKASDPIVEKADPVSIGVSMKEKEELNKLLVSGSEK